MGTHTRRLVAMLACLVLTAVAGCSSIPAGSVAGSGHPATRQYSQRAFSGLIIKNTFHVTVTHGDAFAVSVTVDDNLVKYLRVARTGDALHIGLAEGRNYRDATLSAAVTMPALGALGVSGVSTAAVAGFASGGGLDLRVSGDSTIELDAVRAGAVTIDVSGASHLNGALQARTLRAEVSGAGSLALQGAATNAQLGASGAGRLELADLPLRDAVLQLSGGANGTVRVSGALDIELSGGAHLGYYGSPAIGRNDVSGGASVEHLGA
jgi:hypothetical protein